MGLADSWSYVESGYLGRRSIVRYVTPHHRSRYYFGRTRRVRRSHRRWSYGPPLTVVTRHRRAHPVSRVRVRAPASGVVMRVRRSGPSVTVRRAGRVAIRRHYRAPKTRRQRHVDPYVSRRRHADKPARVVDPFSSRRRQADKPSRVVDPYASRRRHADKPAPTTRHGNAHGRQYGKMQHGKTHQARRPAASFGRSSRKVAPSPRNQGRKQPPRRYKKPGRTRYAPPSTKRVNRANRRNVHKTRARGARVNRSADNEKRRRKGR